MRYCGVIHVLETFDHVFLLLHLSEQLVSTRGPVIRVVALSIREPPVLLLDVVARAALMVAGYGFALALRWLVLFANWLQLLVLRIVVLLGAPLVVGPALREVDLVVVAVAERGHEVVAGNGWAREQFEHEVIGHGVAGFALVQGVLNCE